MDYISQIRFSMFNIPWWIYIYFFAIYLSKCFMNSVRFLAFLPIAAVPELCMEKKASFCCFCPDTRWTYCSNFISLEGTVNGCFLFISCKLYECLSSFPQLSLDPDWMWSALLFFTYLNIYLICAWLSVCLSLDLFSCYPVWGLVLISIQAVGISCIYTGGKKSTLLFFSNGFI